MGELPQMARARSAPGAASLREHGRGVRPAVRDVSDAIDVVSFVGDLAKSGGVMPQQADRPSRGLTAALTR
jgi:hypothetical protein